MATLVNFLACSFLGWGSQTLIDTSFLWCFVVTSSVHNNPSFGDFRQTWFLNFTLASCVALLWNNSRKISESYKQFSIKVNPLLVQLSTCQNTVLSDVFDCCISQLVVAELDGSVIDYLHLFHEVGMNPINLLSCHGISIAPSKITKVGNHILHPEGLGHIPF
jgi:hypothetical protein